MIKSFRGQIADDTTTTIRLSTNNGLTGYRIVKFEAMPVNPDTNVETTIAIFKQKVDRSTDVDFNSPLLLASILYSTSASNLYNPMPVIIFDNEVFNQDIYINIKGSSGGPATMNFHLELEQVKLDTNEATVATLKDMRGRE